MLKTALLAIALLCGTLVFAVAGSAGAQTDPFGDVCSKTPEATVCKENQSTSGQTTSNNELYGPNGAITQVVNLVSILVGIVSVIVIIISGLRLVVSNGDSAKVSSSRNAILYAVIGLIVTAMSQAIIIFVLSRL